MQVAAIPECSNGIFGTEKVSLESGVCPPPSIRHGFMRASGANPGLAEASGAARLFARRVNPTPEASAMTQGMVTNSVLKSAEFISSVRFLRPHLCHGAVVV